MHIYHKLGNHTLQMKILCQHIYALRKLSQPHLGNIARNRRLSGVKAAVLELLKKLILG